MKSACHKLCRQRDYSTLESPPDDEVGRYLVYLKYWTLNLMPVMVYPKVLLPPNFISLGITQLLGWVALIRESISESSDFMS